MEYLGDIAENGKKGPLGYAGPTVLHFGSVNYSSNVRAYCDGGRPDTHVR